jgi:hypothetical protein
LAFRTTSSNASGVFAPMEARRLGGNGVKRAVAAGTSDQRERMSLVLDLVNPDGAVRSTSLKLRRERRV